jgi:single-strand DNA-binding protein
MKLKTRHNANKGKRMALPKVNGLFRLTRDAELKYSQEGKAILKIGLACSEKFGDKETQCFLDATVFGKMAEIISQYAGEKGTQIFLNGKLQTETWQDKDSGQNRSKQSMIVEGFDFVSKPKDSVDNDRSQNTGTKAPVVHERKLP